MSDTNDWNRRIIEEFRENEGRVGGQFEGAPLLLLHTTGIGQDQARVGEQTEHFQIALRPDQDNALLREHGRQTEALDVRASPRMHGPYHGKPRRHLADDGKRIAQGGAYAEMYATWISHMDDGVAAHGA